MNISAPFIRRPVATSLLTIALLLSGVLAYRMLPVSPLPNVVYPVIFVQANLPGASPETMASAVATPLERMFGRIAGITQMTSVEPARLDPNRLAVRSRPRYRRRRRAMCRPPSTPPAGNCRRICRPIPIGARSIPPSLPILVLSLTSDTATQPQMYDVADSILAQKIAQVDGVGQVQVGGSSRPAVRAEVNPLLLSKLGRRPGRGAQLRLAPPMPIGPRALSPIASTWIMLNDNDQLFLAQEYAPLIIAYHNGAPVRLSDVATVVDCAGGHPQRRHGKWQAFCSDEHLSPAAGKHYRHGGPRQGHPAVAASLHSALHPHRRRLRTAPPPSGLPSTISK